MLLITTISLAFLFSLTSSFKLPPTNYPNGTAQPFYPCGYTAAQVSDCPYRCLNATGGLESGCYDEGMADVFIGNYGNCVKCQVPKGPQERAGGCASLDPVGYFTKQHPNLSPCGTTGALLSNCQFICGEAQVPLGLCSTFNDTKPLKICDKCLPQCSSPAVVFQPPSLPDNFSLTAGSCPNQYGAAGLRWCPWRCTKVGNPNSYCSVTDQTDQWTYTRCSRCDGNA